MPTDAPSTPFSPPIDGRPADAVYGRTRFTLSMMRSFRWIGLFHLLFGAILAVLALLSFVCGGFTTLPLLAQTAPATPGLDIGPMLWFLVGMYALAAVCFAGLAVWLLAGAWSILCAALDDDATAYVESALRHVVRLWFTVSFATFAVVAAYAAMTAWIVTNPAFLRQRALVPPVAAPPSPPSPPAEPDAPSPDAPPPP